MHILKKIKIITSKEIHATSSSNVIKEIKCKFSEYYKFQKQKYLQDIATDKHKTRRAMKE